MVGRIRLTSLVVALLLCIGASASASAASAASWTEIDNVGGQIYDVNADRILFAQSADQLALKDRRTQVVTPIDLTPGEQPVAGFLSPHGAIFMTKEVPFGSRNLYEWRDGALLSLGPIVDELFVSNANGLSLVVRGDFAIWNSVKNAGTSSPSNALYRRDLASGTTVEVTSHTTGWDDHDLGNDALRPANDVASNGDVVFSGNGVGRYRNGTIDLLSPPGEFAIYPRTDGATTAWTSADCCPGGTAGASPAGQFDLGTLTQHRPSADLDYAVAGGWVAYTDGGNFTHTVFVRSPTGETTALSEPGPYRIIGVAPNGDVIYGTFDDAGLNATAYLGRVGEDPIPLGTTPARKNVAHGYGDYVFAADGRWYNVAGGSLRRLTLTGAPVAGSETTIDSGPPADDDSPTAMFEFSSTVLGATFETRLDGGPWESTATPSKTYTGLADGQHVFLVRAVEPGGDVDPEPASQTWTVDTVAPVVTLDSPAEGGATADNTPLLDGSAGAAAGDSADVVAKIYAGASASGTPVSTVTVQRSGTGWSASPSSALTDGIYTATATQEDSAGNAGTGGPHTFRVDATQPADFALRSPADGAANRSQNLRLSWDETTDAGTGVARYELWIDGAKNRDVAPDTCSGGECGATPAAPLAEGPHTWQVKAVDGAGNVRETTQRTFGVEAAPPDEFGLVSPADGARFADATPTLTWEAANDSGAGVDHYDVWIDGSIAAANVHGTEFTPTDALSDASHTWHVDAVDGADNVRSSGSRSFTVDTTAPVAALSISPNPALTNSAVTLDASASHDPGAGAIVRYEWDFDGDGDFDADTGATSTATTSYATRGELTPAVRETDQAGNTDTASTALSVRPTPPAGLPGVSIENGARFTNDPDVSVDLVWPPFATTFLMSNDGGFAGATPQPVEDQVPWQLDSSGSERLPKTIYVRFQGLGSNETYQDDIILDETAPRLLSARLEHPRRRTIRLRLRARDNVSGLSKMQLARNRRLPRHATRYRRVVTVSAFSPRLYVRVRDRAGNWSKWHRATRRTSRR